MFIVVYFCMGVISNTNDGSIRNFILGKIMGITQILVFVGYFIIGYFSNLEKSLKKNIMSVNLCSVLLVIICVFNNGGAIFNFMFGGSFYFLFMTRLAPRLIGGTTLRADYILLALSPAILANAGLALKLFIGKLSNSKA